MSIILKSGSVYLLETSGLVQACKEIAKIKIIALNKDGRHFSLVLSSAVIKQDLSVPYVSVINYLPYLFKTIAFILNL